MSEITLEPLRRDQYQMVAEWEYGPPPENADWAKFEREMEEPGWWHYMAYNDGQPWAHISLEQRSDEVMRFHVSRAPESAVHPGELAAILLRLADYLFTGPFAECEAVAPPDRRAVAILAIRCGLTFREETEEGRRYSLTKEERREHVISENRRRAA